MNPVISDACETCGDDLVIWLEWRRFTPAQRARLTELGVRKKAREHECERCYFRRRRNATRRNRRREGVLAEWEMFVDRSVSRWENCRRLAPRIDMTPDALERALDRAGVRGWAA